MAHSSVASASRRHQQLLFGRAGILPAAEQLLHSVMMFLTVEASVISLNGEQIIQQGGRIDRRTDATTRRFECKKLIRWQARACKTRCQSFFLQIGPVFKS